MTRQHLLDSGGCDSDGDDEDDRSTEDDRTNSGEAIGEGEDDKGMRNSM